MEQEQRVYSLETSENVDGKVYRILSISGRCYIGITSKTLEQRFAGHLKDARGGVATPLCNAIRKYGRVNFAIKLLQNFEDWETGCLLEQWWIQKLNSKAPNGYNCTDGGEGVVGPIPEICAKISAALIGKKKSPEHCANMGVTKVGNLNFLGRHHSPEALHKMSVVKIGKKHTLEHRAKVSIALIGNQNALGNHLSLETRAKMSVAKKHYWATKRGNV